MWSRKFRCCILCQTEVIPHQGNGLCKSCYARERSRKKVDYKPTKSGWSLYYEKCQECGTTKLLHSRNGLCKRCDGRTSYRKKTGYKPTNSGWSRRYEQCLNCNSTDNKYESRGLCTKCYSKYRYTKPEYKKSKRKYVRERHKKDIDFKLRNNLRSRLRAALKNNSKKGRTLDYLSCTIDKLKKHLESQFKDGMTWKNYGTYGWHIDHIIPLARFRLANEEEIKKACHYTNLQPMWAKENWSKQAGNMPRIS